MPTLSNTFKPQALFSNVCHFSVHVGTPDKRDPKLNRRQEFEDGRRCALRALQQAGCKNLGDLPSGPNGAPVWPQGFVGSISHSRGWSIAVAAPDSKLLGVGVDAERILTSGAATRLQRKILTEKERTLLPQEFFPLGVSIIFSAKESLYKALNPIVKAYIGFQDVEAFLISPLHAQEGHVRFRLLKTFSQTWNQDIELNARFHVGAQIVTAMEIPRVT